MIAKQKNSKELNMKETTFSINVEDNISGEDILKKLERFGRTCYKSEENITKDSSINFIKGIIKNNHESVLEHEKVSVRIICDRGVTHEIVRHRIGSYSQESTRYCNYTKDKFCNEITVITPSFFHNTEKYDIWKEAIKKAEEYYFKLINLGAAPQEARTVLPNSIKTEIIVTYNLREWRHFLRQRTSKLAHPQMREIALKILSELKKIVPVVFDDIEVVNE